MKDMKKYITKDFKQIVADSMVIITRNRSLEGAVQSLAKEAKICGLMINNRKTKYSICSRKGTANTKQIKLGEQMYENILQIWEWW